MGTTPGITTPSTPAGHLGGFSPGLRALHEVGLRVMLDGVFHHVGRGFWAFRDVQEKKWDSPYKDWFHINFDGNSGYQDGFWYEGWEGHYELVKLNLWNPAVVQHQFDAISRWIQDFDIDGLRLDVAYCLPEAYLKQLRSLTGRRSRFCAPGRSASRRLQPVDESGNVPQRHQL